MTEKSEDTNRIHSDLLHLAGKLVHRGAQTEEERQAAEYIRDRFSEYTEVVNYDEFHGIDSFHFLFACYYSEFLVVGILAIWWPLFAAVYGMTVMALYLGEFLGYPTCSRLMPQFDSQNVMAQFLGTEPKHLLIVTAHYDSGSASTLSNPDVLPWVRPLHMLLLLCMAVVVVSCAGAAWAQWQDIENALLLPLRWGAISMLLLAALALFVIAPDVEDVRGANNNASGVAALLRLAERLSTAPLPGVDVWLTATGSHEAWMSGAHRLGTGHRTPKNLVYVLNIESVGAGQLHYLEAEGMLHRMSAHPHLLEAAESCAGAFNAKRAEMRALPTGLHGMLARGYRGMTIMGLDEDGLPPHWNWPTDRLCEVNEPAIAAAAGFAEAILKHLEQRPA